MTLDSFATLQRGDVIEVRSGKELVIFTVAGKPHTGMTMVDAVDVAGKTYGIYFRDVVSRVG